MMRLGQHPVNLRGGKYTTELGGTLSITRQIDERVVLALLPCRLQDGNADPIVLGMYDDPSDVTEAVLKRAINDFFRVVRVSSVLLSSSLWDRVRVSLLKFSSRKTGWRRFAWAVVNWAGYALTLVLAIVGIGFSYAGLSVSKLPGPNADANELIRRANPTVLRIVGAKWVQWMGDEERFLTLTLSNVSSLDVLDPKVCMLESSSCERSVDSHGTLTPPKGSHLAIQRDRSMDLPFLSESDAYRYLRGKVSGEFQILKWGLDPELPADLEHSCESPRFDTPLCMVELLSIGVPVNVEWDTTLDEKNSSVSAVYAHMEKVKRAE